jgi:hypothetical protein
MLERSRRNSVMTKEPSTEEQNSANNQYTFSASSSSFRRPSVFTTETIRKMHSAVELNKKILEKSKDASLVLMNIPEPPKTGGSADFNCKPFVLIYKKIK